MPACMSLRRAVSFSASPRELTNTSVVRCFSISSRTLRSMAGHTEPPTSPGEAGLPVVAFRMMPLRSASDSMAGVTPEIRGVRGFRESTPPARRLASEDLGPCTYSRGSTTFKSIAGRVPGLIIRTACAPPRNRAASSGGFTVADRPIRCTG